MDNDGDAAPDDRVIVARPTKPGEWPVPRRVNQMGKLAHTDMQHTTGLEPLRTRAHPAAFLKTQYIAPSQDPLTTLSRGPSH